MSIKIIKVKNPLNRSDREIGYANHEDKSLAVIKKDHIPDQLEVTASIGGEIVPKEKWDIVKPGIGEEIVFLPVIRGGGDDGKQMLGMVLMIALTVAVGPAGFGLMSMGIGGMALGVAIMVGGSLLINSLMPKPKAPEFTSGKDITAYGWNPRTVQRQGIPLPRAYGKNRLYGNVISVYTEPGTDPTEQMLYMLIAYGEGVVNGITQSNGIDYDITINDQPAANYEAVEFEEKRGTLGQSAITLFSDTKAEYRQNRLVTNSGGAEIITTPDDDYDDLEIEIFFDRGLYHLDSAGDIGSYGVNIEIRISEHDAGVWTTLVDETITKSTTAPVRKAYTASGSYTGGSSVTITRGTKYDIEVTKVTADKSSSYYGDRVLVGAIREVFNDSFQYPGISMLAVKAIATDQLSGGINVSAVQEGRVVQVYDDGTETWSIVYSDNPAWVLYDILTQPIISGDGSGTAYDVERYEGLSPANINLASIVELADFCDELVPSGIGSGTEKRITFNGVFDTSTTMWEAALKVCEIARCVLIWNGTEVKVVVDKAANPVQMFNVSNMHTDTFKQTFLPQTERASEIEIHYRDAEQDYQRVPFTVHNSEAGDFENKVTLELFGITKQSEAYRAGMFRLAQNILLKSTIEFQADIDAIACELGDVIYVQHDVPDWTEGGRIVSATSNTITVDKAVTPTGGTDYVLVRVINTTSGEEQIENHAVQSVSGNVITIADTFTTVPSQYDLFCYGASDGIAKQYRIIGMETTIEQRVKITAIEYNSTIYTYDNDDPVIPISDYDSPGSTENNVITPPSFDKIRREYPKSSLGMPTMDIPFTVNLAWADEGGTVPVDNIAWSAADGTNPILLKYQGVTYEITASNTLSKYIYWDINDDNVFLSTDTLANAIGTDKWLMAYNDAGIAYPAWGKPVIHGGLIQAGTLKVTSADIDSLSADKITSGTLDASVVTVSNLVADNIVTGSIKAGVIDNATVNGITYKGATGRSTLYNANSSVSADSWKQLASKVLGHQKEAVSVLLNGTSSYAGEAVIAISKGAVSSDQDADILFCTPKSGFSTSFPAICVSAFEPYSMGLNVGSTYYVYIKNYNGTYSKSYDAKAYATTYDNVNVAK